MWHMGSDEHIEIDGVKLTANDLRVILGGRAARPHAGLMNLWLLGEAIASTKLSEDPTAQTYALTSGNCPKNPTGGDHEDQEQTDPMTGLPIKVCKHCGRVGS